MVASTRWDKAPGSRRALRVARKDEPRMVPRRANDDSTPSINTTATSRRSAGQAYEGKVSSQDLV